jgi:methylisocitrate lyase
MNQTSDNATPGARFRRALDEENPLQLVGVIHAYAAIMAEKTGFRALYISGAGVANASHGLPDLGMTHMGDVAEDVRRITSVTALPVLVDIDTGWGSALNIARAIKTVERAGAAAVHIEDQALSKRCGHRPGKAIVETGEMVDRIKTAVDARSDASFVIMARTDAFAREGLDAALDRCLRYKDAGADMIFPEALTSLDEYRAFVENIGLPVLANITEFGKTPLFTTGELKSVGVRMALYPLSAFRAMNAAALAVYETLRKDGTQKNVLNMMQTRDDLYRYLGYHAYEQKLDELFKKEGEHGEK